jgi:uncharacterized YccA/Bax inhibitor family protein
MRLRSSNPVLRNVTKQTYLTDRPVTFVNVAYKSIFLMALVMISAFTAATYGGEFLTLGTLIGALVIAFISVIIGTRSVRMSPIFSSIYAICEGFVLGVVSALYASIYEGIIPTALTTTLIVFVVMLLLYSTRVIKITQRFLSVMVVALISVIVMSLLSFILPFVGNSYYIICFISAILSAFFLLVDFSQIETCVESGVDNQYGWVLSLGLLVTIVWIYVEMLRLLAIFGRRN